MVTSEIRPLPKLVDYATALLPASPEMRGEVIEADESWTLDDAFNSDADVFLWGRVPYRSMTALKALGRHVAHRERAVSAMSARPPGGLSKVGLYRLTPPPGTAGILRAGLRDFAFGGAIIELVPRARPKRVVDAAAEAAGVRLKADSLDLGSDRTALARAATQGGEELILRVAPSGAASDPSSAQRALELLEAAGVQQTPRLLARGQAAGAGWSLESILPGRPPRRITRGVAAQVLVFCASLPSAEGPPSALGEELETLGRLLPDREPDFERVRDRFASVNDEAPAVLRHGDLWRGNLLVRRGRLSGVIDWDTWHPSSLPGVDVLHLFVSQAKQRSRRQLGEVWVDRPWRSRAFADFSRPYWSKVDLSPDMQQMHAVGTAWWTCWVSRTLRRHPRLLRDGSWMRRNVESVLETLVK